MKRNMIAAKNIDEYIMGFPEDLAIKLEKLRQTIKKAAPNSTEAISYAIPTFKLDGKNLVHFAGYKTHIGFYPGSGAIEAFKNELAAYNLSKGTVQFPMDKPIPSVLVSNMVKFCILKIREQLVVKKKNND
ncbi:MAG: DUF1801 domain-containing protein [Chitinophagaceae bacterium]|nr:DUF1801 domain-containing protein [Chitinophagaceae bacterium]